MRRLSPVVVSGGHSSLRCMVGLCSLNGLVFFQKDGQSGLVVVVLISLWVSDSLEGALKRIPPPQSFSVFPLLPTSADLMLVSCADSCVGQGKGR